MAANFLQSTDLGSDTDDDDYVPDANEVAGLSEEEGDGDDEGLEGGSQKSKKKTTKKAKVGAFGETAEVDKETEEMKKEFEKEKIEMKEQEEKKKVDDLWAGKIQH